MNGTPARRLVLLTASAALAVGAVSGSSGAFAAPRAAGAPSATPATPSPEPTPEMSAAAELYLNHALDLLQNNSMDTKKVDWPQVRHRAYAEAAGAKTTADTQDAIDLAVKALDNPHTTFMRPDQAAEFEPSPEAEAPDTGVPPPMPRGCLVGQEIGQVSLPTTDRIAGYAKTGAHLVRTLDAARPCGWIVDLRADSGGAIWPKLDVLAPLVGDGHLGGFVDADGNQAAWTLHRGQLSIGGEVVPKDIPPSIETGASGVKDYVTHNAYVLKRPRPPVAVLTGPNTASAGEAALIAFRGRTDSRSFGLPTAGLATGNASYPLNDGALLLVTSAADMDRTGRRYVNTPITPDVHVTFTDHDIHWGTDDPVIDTARKWLESRPACKK